MRLNEHKRHKHGHLPGDVPKETKITMREGGIRQDILVCFGRKTALKVAKTYRRDLLERAKAQQRQRDQALIREHFRQQEEHLR